MPTCKRIRPGLYVRLKKMSPPARPSAGADIGNFSPDTTDQPAPARPRGRSPQAVDLPTRFDLAAWSDSEEDDMSMSEDSSW
ncbi:hypothetical protein MY10362_009064 [Beauveria mimosiformis]